VTRFKILTKCAFFFTVFSETRDTSTSLSSLLFRLFVGGGWLGRGGTCGVLEEAVVVGSIDGGGGGKHGGGG